MLMFGVSVPALSCYRPPEPFNGASQETVIIFEASPAAKGSEETIFLNLTRQKFLSSYKTSFSSDFCNL